MRLIRLLLVALTVVLVAGTSSDAFAAALSPTAAGRGKNVPQAEMSVDTISLSQSIKEGDKIGAQSIFAITLKNNGSAPSKESDVKITISALNGGPAPEELSGTLKCRALQPGESMGFAWPGLSNNTWADGRYRLTVEADSGKVIAEANELNNVKTFDFTVTPKLSNASGMAPAKTPGIPMPEMIALTAPLDGAMWCMNTTEKIIWQNKGAVKSGTAKILLLKDEKVFRIISEAAGLAKGEHAWTIPGDIPEGNYRVRVISNANEDIRGTSGTLKFYKILSNSTGAPDNNTNKGNPSSQPSSVTLTSPLGGEKYTSGQQIPITWKPGNLNRFVTLTLEKKEGGTLEITDKAALSAGTYMWGVPYHDQKYNGKFKVKIQINGTNHTDRSADYFTISVTEGTAYIPVIMTSPAEGDSWKAGESHDVTWEYGGDSAGKKIHLELESKNHSSIYNYRDILSGAPASGQKHDKFTWKIPDDLEPGQYILNVYGGFTGKSGVFTVRSGKDQSPKTVNQSPKTAAEAQLEENLAPIAISAPKHGERWEIGTSQTITWNNKSKVTGTAKVVLMQGETAGRVIKNSVPFDKGSHSVIWLIDSGLYQPGTYKIRIISNSDNSIQGISNEFALVPKVGITLNSPHSGSYQSEQELPISWNYTGDPSLMVKLTLEKEGGGTKLIKDNLPIGASGAGHFTWTIPGQEKTGAWEFIGAWKVKVQVKGTQQAALSDNYLTIKTAVKPELAIINPVAGATWQAGSQQNVIFSHKGYVGPVVNISLVKGGSLVFTRQLDEYQLDSSGQTKWSFKLPQDLAYGNDYEFHISGSTVETQKKVTSGPFTITGNFGGVTSGFVNPKLPQ